MDGWMDGQTEGQKEEWVGLMTQKETSQGHNYPLCRLSFSTADK